MHGPTEMMLCVRRTLHRWQAAVRQRAMQPVVGKVVEQIQSTLLLRGSSLAAAASRRLPALQARLLAVLQRPAPPQTRGGAHPPLSELQLGRVAQAQVAAAAAAAWPAQAALPSSSSSGSGQAATAYRARMARREQERARQNARSSSHKAPPPPQGARPSQWPPTNYGQGREWRSWELQRRR
jgi:hypothetical protein